MAPKHLKADIASPQHKDFFSYKKYLIIFVIVEVEKFSAEKKML